MGVLHKVLLGLVAVLACKIIQELYVMSLIHAQLDLMILSVLMEEHPLELLEAVFVAV